MEDYGTTSTNGKAPVMSNGGSKPANHTPIVAVQPPRREDLQPSYAQVLKPDTADDSVHGWYGNMIGMRRRLLGLR